MILVLRQKVQLPNPHHHYYLLPPCYQFETPCLEIRTNERHKCKTWDITILCHTDCTCARFLGFAPDETCGSVDFDLGAGFDFLFPNENIMIEYYKTSQSINANMKCQS